MGFSLQCTVQHSPILVFFCILFCLPYAFSTSSVLLNYKISFCYQSLVLLALLHSVLSFFSLSYFSRSPIHIRPLIIPVKAYSLFQSYLYWWATLNAMEKTFMTLFMFNNNLEFSRIPVGDRRHYLDSDLSLTYSTRVSYVLVFLLAREPCEYIIICELSVIIFVFIKSAETKTTR